MKRCLSLVLLLGLLLPMLLVSEPMPSAAQAFQSKPGGPPVVLRADPDVSTHRVPAPARAFTPQRVQSANITITYLPAGATDKFNYSCLAWPAAAQTAFTYAADIWETLIDSSVTIVIHACWADMEEGILGGGAPDDYYRNFSGTPVPDTWYPVALANALHGSDLDSTNPDMHLVYSKKFQDTNQWYFGTDGNPPWTQYDFTSVVLHEIAHGLGFAGSMQFLTDGSQARWGYGTGYPFSYDPFTEDGSGNALINTAVYPNPSTALGNALTGNNIWFDGPHANTANGGGRVKLYAPSTWQPGSSYSHLDEIFNGTQDSLMTYSLSKGESNHAPGPVGMSILHDAGWPINAPAPPPAVSSITSNTGANTGSVAVTIAGSDFQTGATVKLTKTGQPDINATGVVVVNASQITGNFNLSGVATGAWNVVVTNPDAQSGMLSNGFTVTFSGKTWTGAISADWHTSGNWNSTGVPAIGDDVIIPDVVRDPIISTSDAAVNNLTINSGATVDLTDRTLTVEGTLTNNGTLKQTQDVAQDVSTEFLRITNQAGNQTKYYGVDITPQSNAYFSSEEALRLVELKLDSLPARSAATHSATTPLVPAAPVPMLVDDGVHETAYGVNDNTAMTGKQFIWLNRFTPGAAAYPFTLDEIWVMFDSFGGGANVNVGDAIDLVVYQDADGNPANGATWVATIQETVQAVNGATWSVYSLSSPVLLEGPGDVIIAVINRYAISGVSSITYPATVDTTMGQDRSWIGWWATDPPSPPTLPPSLNFNLMTGETAGNWLIRGYGSNSGEAPNIEISPVSFEETLAVDEILTQTLIISNTGTAPLTFVIDVQNEGFTPALCAPAIMENNVSATPARDPGLHSLEWAGAASMPTARARLAGATADGCLLYAIGGSLIGTSSFFNNNEVYDPQSNSWAALASMPTARNGVGAAAVDGVIYVPGGYNGSSLNVHEAYNITDNSWSSRAALPVALSGGAVVAANGKVYHIGGNTGSSYTDAIYEYNPTTNAWSTKAAAPEAFAYAGGAVLNGYIYIAGGWLSTSSASTRFWRYDPVGNSWTVLASMSQGRQSPGLVAAGGYIYAFGGGVGWTPRNTTEQYNTATNTWTSRPDSPLAVGRIGMATGWVRGKIWGVGGTTGSGAEDDNEYLDEGYADNCGGVTPPWLSVNPATGQAPAGSSLTVDVVFDATGLTAGDYTADLVITSNDPDENLVIVPTLMHVVTDTTPHFAYINQPWDWIDGVTDPEAAINATLNRAGSTIATASTTSDANGRFSFHFLSDGNHLDLLVGDEVVVTGGGLDATLTLIDIGGSIDIAANRVTGQALGGVFPTSGVASVGWLSALGFTAQEFQFANDGSFVVDFDGVTDIDADYLAKVNYTDPNGNMVVQLFNPEGLDIRVLISEGRVEGVTTPGETVSVLVSDANGPKASATVTADMTGFYTTLVYDRGHKVSLNLGDHIEVKNSTRIRSTTLTMFHVSYLQPWNNRVIGNILGVNYPPEGGTGRVDLWSVSEQKWYTQYIGIGPYGVYEANFDGIVDMMDADIVRVWATFPDGNQQAALGWGLHLGVSPSDDEVWGYTAAESTVDVRLYRGLVDGQPVDLIGTATTTAHSSGYFSTTVMSGGQLVDIAPSNVVIAQTANYMQSLFVGKISATADVDEDRLTISGLPNSILHIEGRRKGVKREDAPFQDDYIWREVSLDATGTVVVDLSAFDLQPDDVFDLTCYIEEQGLAIHTVTAVRGEVSGLVYLPLVVRDSN